MKLSFVIPTLNFAAFLPHTLDSIVDEGLEAVEIVVFDGGSTDDTLAVLERYRGKFPALRVVSAIERGNIDIDLNKAVAEAAGDYVWTMSADDALMPGWSQRIVAELAGQPDILLVPAVHCDVEMRPRRNYPIVQGGAAGPLRMTITGDDDLLAYLDRVRTSEGLFSFCSACVVRRERLQTAPLLEKANGTCWRYSARLISVLTTYPSRVVALDEPLIYKRGDNDSFSHAGPIRRLRIATKSWDDAIACLDANPRIASAMAARVKSDIKPTSLLYLSQFIRDQEEQAIYNDCVRSRLGAGGMPQWTFAQVLMHFPSFSLLRRALLVARPLYRRLQRHRWERRLPAATAGAGTSGKTVAVQT